MLKENRVNIQDQLDVLDKQIMDHIVIDMINGTLYQEADDITLLMMLEMMAVNKEVYRTQGIVIGEA
jgi:hypothetical protein|tara:strand:- start:27 stop:227 length:201 start_codon:yes stop_codon:yes gene_type:complete